MSQRLRRGHWSGSHLPVRRIILLKEVACLS